MFHNPPSVSSSFRDSSQNGIFASVIEFKRPQLSALRSYSNTLGLKFEPKVQLHKGRASTRIFADYKPTQKKTDFSKEWGIPQNVDLPAILPKKKKKPFPIPLKKMRQASRKDKKLAEMGIEKPLKPPKNGLLVTNLIPVAHELLEAWKILIRGVAQLLHVVSVYGCSECSEVHVGPAGHTMQDCKGRTAVKRRGFHSWVKGSINDVLIPIDSYHLFDPFGRRVKHDTRFVHDRIPAIVELCIQAGADIPGYPSRRRTSPIRMIGRKIIDYGGNLEEPEPDPNLDQTTGPSLIELDTAYARLAPPPSAADVLRIAQETMDAHDVVGLSLARLMRKYTVKACGYCSEVHVGPWGHNVKLCGEFKHQWRDGKHGWQDAVLDEVFPPNFVWHVRDPIGGPPMRTGLKRYYGKTPAVVELCYQAGATIPERYKPMMRLDIIVPDSEESKFVA